MKREPARSRAGRSQGTSVLGTPDEETPHVGTTAAGVEKVMINIVEQLPHRHRAAKAGLVNPTVEDMIGK